MKRYALIVAGGSGSRMGTEVPKQFLDLAGKPVLMHTIERFWSFDNSIEIITVLPEIQIQYWNFLQKEYSFCIPHTLVPGGDSRFLSVKNGLNLIGETGLVAVHDGVRPLVSSETIRRCFEAAEKYGNAVPVISPADSLRMLTGETNKPVNRHDIKIIQTPQVFNTGLIRQAYLQEYNPDFTDDATVVERTGQAIHLVEGNRENIKITNPEDLIISASLLPTIS
jgi:2-C-methyl-D-erythritol 4-phosphate cytidylyltransferase